MFANVIVFCFFTPLDCLQYISHCPFQLVPLRKLTFLGALVILKVNMVVLVHSSFIL
jgi:hypothetical protein